MSEDESERLEISSSIDETEHRQALARALLGMPEHLDEAERLRLHKLLDQVLDYRAEYDLLPRGLNALRELMLGGRPNPEEGRLSQAAFTAATELFVRSLGGIRTAMLPPLGMDPTNARTTLQFWLLRLGTILRHPATFGGIPSITLDQVIEELEDLGFGDQGSIFRATPRKAGQKQKQGKLARFRLKALAWERYLRSQGVRPGEAQTKVSSAFGDTWDTIQKWKKRVCIPLLGEWRVNYELSAADAGGPPSYNVLRSIDDQLIANGKEYRATLAESKNPTC